MGIIPIKNRKHGHPKLRFALASTVAMATAMSPAFVQAVEWRFMPTLDVRGTYTDNVRLAPSGAEKSDFITEISPGINVVGSGRGLKARARYGFQYLHYADDSEGNKIHHQLDAAANAELIENLFFLDSSANVSQENVSAFGPQPVDNTNVTSNRATVRTYTVSPYLRHRFGSTASSEARYSRTSTSTNTGGLSDANTDSVLFSLFSGPAFSTVGWSLLHSQQRNQFEDAPDVDNRTTSGALRYMLTPRFHLTATGGYDKFDYISTGEEPSGWFYTGGFSWKPTDRTSLAASAGRRFWGNTYMLQSSVRGRSSLWQLSYDEGITTTQSQFAIQATTSTSDFLNLLFQSSIPDPTMRQQVVDRFIVNAGLPSSISRPVNYFTNQFFLQKILQASAAFTGTRNTVVISLHNTSRKSQTAVTADDALRGTASQSLNANTRQTGLNTVWMWRVTPLTNASLNATYARTRLETNDALQRLKSLRAVITTQIQPKVNAGVELRRQMQSTDLPGGDYVENAITAFVSMRF